MARDLGRFGQNNSQGTENRERTNIFYLNFQQCSVGLSYDASIIFFLIRQYGILLQNSLREVEDLKLAYAPQPSFDDMAWFGLAYARVHELFNLQGFLRVAKNVYSWNWTNGWDISGTYVV